MLAARPHGSMAMNNGAASQHGEVLRLLGEAHDQHVAGSCLGHLDANKAWLAFHDPSQHAGRDARIPGHIDILGANGGGDGHQQAGAVERLSRNASLMHKWRADLGTGGGDDIGAGHFTPREA